MSAQSNIEKSLRDIHVMLSKCKVYNKNKNQIIVDKKALITALSDLSKGVYEAMDEYELTQSSRDQAERAVRKNADEIIADAKGKAEDVYAGSVLYTDEALKHVRTIMQDAAASMQDICRQMQLDMEKEIQRVRTDQTGLTGYLQDLADTDKYLKIIEERNKEQAKKRANEKKEPLEPSVAAPKPEIRINEAYFREHGLSLDEEDEALEEKPEKVMPEINVNLDSEYFKWKEQESVGTEILEIKRTEKKSLFGRIGR